MRTHPFALLPLLFAIPGSAQIVINTTQSPTQLVQDILLGGGLTATNITFNGVAGTVLNNQMGSFDGTNCNIGLAAGVILATGDVHGAEGPNNSSSNTEGGGHNGASDPDLALLSGQVINDKAVLEFDFVPTGDTLKFNFVFGSDEYLEFVNSINDAFGFFLSGPDITGPYTDGAVNIALVPNTTTPITINNVNSTTNSAYYIDNGDGFTSPYNTSSQYVQYDGFTVVMTARHAVTCGLTYHIKIAIGDASDTSWDSGVFLEAGSFASTGQAIPTLGSGLNMPNDSTMLEGCGEVPFSFMRLGDTTNIDTVHLTIGGTATPGVDYSPPFPAELIFQPGDTMINFPLDVPFDADGQETLTIELVQTLACSGVQVTNDYTFYIDQFPPLYVVTLDVQGQCQQDYVIAPLQEGGTGSYGYLWSTGETTPSITVSVNTTTTFYVTVSDTCSVVPVEDSITVFIPVSQPLQLESETPIQLHCDQDSILLTATYGGGYGNVEVHWGEDSLIVPGDQLWVPGREDGDYIVSVSDECESSTSQLVHVDAGCQVIIPNVITPNGDGSNDVFVVKGILGKDNQVQIYDRWGVAVLDVRNYRNTFRATDLPDGVYFYKIRVEDEKYTGHLTVLGNE